MTERTGPTSPALGPLTLKPGDLCLITTWDRHPIVELLEVVPLRSPKRIWRVRLHSTEFTLPEDALERVQ